MTIRVEGELAAQSYAVNADPELKFGLSDARELELTRAFHDAFDLES